MFRINGVQLGACPRIKGALVIIIFATALSCSGNDTYYLIKHKFTGLKKYELDPMIIFFTDLPEGEHYSDISELSERIVRFKDIMVNNYGMRGFRSEIMLIVFNDVDSYYSYMKSDKKNSIHTPYGFYQSSKRVIVVNYRAGDGTITHELVHALIEDDYKNLPIWLNEGMASLYEECLIRDNTLKGVANWRFKNISVFLNSKSNLVSWLAGLDSEKFYNDDPEMSYALARLFCYYLQESNKLIPLYKKIRRSGSDKYGVSTLQELFGERIDQIDARFKLWLRRIDK